MVDLELTWQYSLSEFRQKQTKAVCVNLVHLSLWASLAARILHHLLPSLCVSLITSIQPPLATSWGSGLDYNRTFFMKYVLKSQALFAASL